MTGVVVCSWGMGRGGGPPTGTEELLTLGRKTARALDAPLAWVVLGPLPNDAAAIAGRHGVASVEHVTDGRLERFEADVYVEALAQYCRASSPRLVLVSQTHDARLLAPRLAGRLGATVVMNAIGLAAGEGERLQVTASAYGGDTRVVYDLAAGTGWVVGVATSVLVPEPLADGAGAAPVREVGVDLASVKERIRVIARAVTEGPRIEDADIIVAGGRGLGAPENFRLVQELADALGGMAGASRPIVDEGWTDPSRQVGLTGRITRPVLYIAVGISGASQHMVGCAGAKTLVAINRDPEAAVFRYARYGIVGDCLEILPELIRVMRT
jgi:electron transfer flavoprotein alpha subunit